MVQITLHIERLLVHNDCVIVPGLGGFVAQDCSAKFVEEEDLFLPPYRSVSFNQRLTMNDGLLVHDVAQHHHLDYKEAARIVDDEVSRIREIIDNEGRYTFHGIGTLSVNEKGNYNFEPIACGVSAPDLYGLDCFYVTPLHKVQPEAKKVSVSKHDDDSLTLRLHMNVVRYAAVAAVAAVFFFVCIAPLNSAIEHQRSEAGMLHYLYSLIVNKNKEKETPVDKKTVVAITSRTVNKVSQIVESDEVHENLIMNDKAESPNGEASELSQDKSSMPANPVVYCEDTTKRSEPFAIVVASCVTEPNANAMIDSWKKKGLTEASICNKGKFLRVFYGTYESYTDAHAALKKFRTDYPAEFSEAWVYEIP